MAQITANNQTVAYNQSVALSSLFTVAGGGSITSYNVWFNGSPDGSVTNNGAAIATGQTVNVSSLANLNYVGGVAAVLTSSGCKRSPPRGRVIGSWRP